MMKKILAVSAIACAVFTGFVAPSTAVAATVVIGAPLIDRPVVDQALGSIFVLNSGFTQAGVLTSYAYYNDNAAQFGFSATPLLLSILGGNYIITGVGTPGVNAATGSQTFGFGLVSGSAAVGPGTLFGFKDGANANPGQAGVVEYNFVPTGTTAAGTQQYFGGGHANDLFAGSNLGSGGTLGARFSQLDRDYSIQATAQITPQINAIPEPTTMTLACLGGLLLIGVRLRGERASRNTPT